MGLKTRLRMLASALAVSLAAAACGGSMSLDDYVVGAEGAAADYGAETDRLRSAYTEALRVRLEDLAALREQLENTAVDEEDTARLAEETEKFVALMVSELSVVYAGAAEALEGLIADLDELDPPSEIADAHDAYVSTLARSLESLPSLVASLSTARTPQDITGIFNTSDFGDTQPRVSALCSELEDAAASGGQALDLRCSAAAVL